MKVEIIAERTCASVTSRVRYANAAEMENENGHRLLVTKRKRIQYHINKQETNEFIIKQSRLNM